MPRFPSINIGSGGGSGGGSGVSSAWGGITGTLAAQADLKAALDAKADDGAELTATWGQIAGSISNQEDLLAFLGGGGVPGVELVVYQLGSDNISAVAAAGPGRDYIRPTADFTIVGWLATVFKPSNAEHVRFDVNVNGLSIFNTNKIRIDTGEKSSATAAVVAEGLYINVHAHSEITVDIDTSDVGATGWRLTLYGIRANLGAAPSPPVNSVSVPTIAGTFSVGGVVTVNSLGTWSNTPIGYSYEWLRDGVVVDWTSGASYTNTAADAGKTLSVRVTASNGGGSGVATSIGHVIALPVPENQSPPSIGASATEGISSVASNGAWIYAPTTFAYVWHSRATSGDAWAVISGAISLRFTPSGALVGKQIRVGVQGINASGPSASIVYSAAVDVVASRFSAAWPPPPKADEDYADPTLPLTGTNLTYNVGPGQTHTELNTVPWRSLTAGDVVNIYWRATPYLTKFAITGQGTLSNKIIIHGVMTVGGLRPHLSAAGATTADDCLSLDGTTERFFSAQYTERAGLIFINRRFVSGLPVKPKHIRIENLEITDAFTGSTFTDQFGGTKNYTAGAGGIYAVVVENLEVENCEIHGNSNGVFWNQKDDDESYASYFVYLRRNKFYDNGEVGSYYEHNIYSQGVRTLIEGNYIGKLRNGAIGSAMKDRSSGTVVRFNEIHSAARNIDLVDQEGGGVSAYIDPLYPYAWVYGNLIINDWKINPAKTSSAAMIHWSSDHELPRNGTLFFYQNTVIVRSDTSDYYHISVFECSTLQSVVESNGNILARYGNTIFNLGRPGLTVNFKGTNWITSGWTPINGAGASYITNTGTLIETDSDPLLTSAYKIITGSPVMNKGLASIVSPPSPAAAANLQVTYQPGPAGSGTMVPRVQLGTDSDLGCFETNTGEAAPPPPPDPEILDPLSGRVLNFTLANALTLTQVNFKFAGAPLDYVTDTNALRLKDAAMWSAGRVRWVDGQGANQASIMVRRGQTWGASAGGIGLTLQDDGTNLYYAQIAGSTWDIRRNGVWMGSGSTSVTWTADVTLSFSITAGVLEFRINGTLINGSMTDASPLTGGHPGFLIVANGAPTAHYIESWSDTP